MKINKKYLNLIIVLIFTILLSLIKISFISGSHKLFFSGINFALPVIGNFFGAFSGVIVFAFLLFKKLTVGGALTLGMPTLFATVYISLINNKKNNLNKLYIFLLSVILPLSCMIIFSLNPVGNQAFIYSFYWFIPVILYFVNKNNLFFEYLTATFIAHAIGSIIWLYTVPMTASQWLGLVPVVFVERLVFASGLYLVFMFTSLIEERVFNVFIKKNNKKIFIKN
ncbi:MAG: hypothetical protein SZ59_C0002G0316 [candidate division TM6 bacterium GW2011_GWF2_28_16]|nr:MAG: hypothetical protein SZ59_C0002G0316 [candidate division TM6 bacterium GW2011_GWF2_28_16]